MKIEIPYGRGHTTVDIPEPNILEVIRLEKPAAPGDEERIVAEALRNPIASPPLRELAEGKKSAAVLVSDVTRPCPSYKFLPSLLDELEPAGVEDVSIVFGLGIHRAQTDAEKRSLVGEDVAARVNRLADSSEGGYESIGRTGAGTPIEICREVLGRDLLIATGNLEYHYFAGYSAGAKAVLPGACSRRTVQANHSLMLDDRAVAGRHADNPLRQDIEEAGRVVGIDFLFNVILDDRKKIIAAVAGKNNEAHLRGIGVYDGLFKRAVREKADIVITSPGGHPKDMNLYQSQKALDNIKDIVKDGGEIILVASCEEGYGERVFEEWMADVKDYRKLHRRIREEFVLGGHKAVAISKLLAKTKVRLYSCYGPEETERLGFIKAGPLQPYLENRIAASPGLKIIVVPGGSFVQYGGAA
jgi:nickel-dependent lactate racemase